MIRRFFYTTPHIDYIHWILLLIRLSALVLLLNHGLLKFTNLLSGEEIKFGDPIGLGPQVSFILVVFAEFFCSALVILGLCTRLASIPPVINFLVIVFVVHLHDPFARKELPLFYLVFFIILLILGGGKYSMDYFLFQKTARK